MNENRYCALRSFRLRLGLFGVLLISTGHTAQAEVGAESSLFGAVTDLRGDPVPAAEINLYELSLAKDGVEVRKLASVLTDSAGGFRFENVSAGSYMVRAWLAGFATTRIWDVYVNPGENHLLNLAVALGGISPARPTTASGEVRGSDGNPLPNATITLRDAFNAGILVQTRSDSKGRYKFELVFCGDYVITAFNPGFQVAAASHSIECGRDNVLEDLRLSKTEAN